MTIAWASPRLQASLVDTHDRLGRLGEDSGERVGTTENWDIGREERADQSTGAGEACADVGPVAGGPVAQQARPHSEHGVPVARTHQGRIVGAEIGDR